MVPGLLAVESRRRSRRAVAEGALSPIEYHHASFEVGPEGDRAGRPDLDH
jgi:hypothetical protein